MRFTPLRISLIFIIIALVWITTTDHLLEWWLDDSALLTQFQTVKGIFFITVIAIALYYMVKNYEKSLQREQELISKIFSAIPVMITIYRPQISDFSVNREFEKIMGWSNEEASKLNLMEKIYPDEEYRKVIREFMENPDDSWKDIEVVNKEGKTLQTAWTNIRLNDETQIGIGIDISNRKKIEQELKNKEEWLKLSTTSSNVGMWEWHPQTGTLVIDELWAKLVGYSLAELQPLSIETWNRLLHPEDMKVFEDAVEKYFRGETNIYECEVRMLHKDGSWRWILDRGRTVEWDEEGNAKRLVGTHVDITYRKVIEDQIEHEKHLFKTAVNLVSDIVYDWDVQSDSVFWNDGITTSFGYSDKNIRKSLDFWIENIHSDDRNRVLHNLESAMQNNKGIWTDQYRFLNANGDIRHVEDNAFILRDNEGRVIRMIGAINDHTEKKKANELLEYQAGLLKVISDAVISTDENFVIKSWNNAAEKTYGWKADEVTGRHISDVLTSTYFNTTENEALETLLQDGEWSGEVIQKTKSGKPKNILSSVKIIRNEKKEIAGSVAINRDITERIKVESENLLLGDLFLRSNTGLAITNHRTNKLERVNKAYADLFGYSIIEMAGKDIYEVYPEKSRNDIKNKLEDLKKNGFISFEAELLKKNGTPFFGLINLSLIHDKNTDAQYRLSTIIDITQIKEFEKKLDEEQKRFEIAANIVSDVIWEWNPGKSELWWGEGIETVFGFKKEQYLGDIKFWHKQIAEYDRDRVVESMMEAENSDAVTWKNNYDFVDADGSIRKIKDSAAIIRNKDGGIIRIIGSMLDNTTELAYQEELKKQSNKFEMIAKSSNDILFEWDIKTDYVWWSEGWISRFNYKENEIEHTTDWWISKIHPKSREKIRNSLKNAVIANEDTWIEYYEILNGNGTYSVVIDKGYFIKDKDGINEYMVGTISDITTDVRAQEELRASEEQYRLLFEQSPLPMYIYDPETLHFITANLSALNKYGYTMKELRSMKIFDLHPEEDLEAIKNEIRRSLQFRHTDFDIWPQITSGGDRIIAEISGTDIYYDGRNLRLVIANDITRQKKAEERAISAIVEGEERERQRIAKELHDGLGQYLSASNMNLKSVYEDLGAIAPDLSKAFESGLKFLNHAISETRNISQNLLPKAIQDYGLELAAESLINQLQSQNSIKFYLYKNLCDIEIPDNIQINLYRILQEALNNAIRHGKPEKIDVQLVYTENELFMTIEDNGIGFNVDEKLDTGIGLRSMKTRVGGMAANLDITSNKGRGTIISVVVPLNVNVK
ncbi:MAG: PAS domain S-box protein [Balneolaceae bacterium]|nr:MAG: PAS domain S-box protein [Balneolaceae bacterium]